jgi:DNA-binding NarL/FixJ family response regulator
MREREVLNAVARGHGNQAIAKQLGIAEKTVRNHVSIIFDKLGVESRSEAIVIARERGFGR